MGDFNFGNQPDNQVYSFELTGRQYSIRIEKFLPMEALTIRDIKEITFADDIVKQKTLSEIARSNFEDISFKIFIGEQGGVADPRLLAILIDQIQQIVTAAIKEKYKDRLRGVKEFIIDVGYLITLNASKL